MEYTYMPGPWSKAYDGHGGICITGSNGVQIGFVSAGSSQEGNAARIAAVPDMLAALETIASGNADPDQMIELARAAITKAAGGHQ